jgi:hypothetical protein
MRQFFRTLPQIDLWSRAMADRASGTVTFLFTDIERSTVLWERATASTVPPPILKRPEKRQIDADHGVI